jgi:hypothetical protein
MYILKTVPTTLSFEAVPFVPGSRADYDNVVGKVKKCGQSLLLITWKSGWISKNLLAFQNLTQ